MRDIGNRQNLNSSGVLQNGTGWPSFSDWQRIANSSMPDKRQYDSLADPNSNARQLEITALVPNQFDVTHYSIDPDFFNNYYKRIYNGFDKLKAAATGLDMSFDKNALRSDIGAIQPDASVSSQPAPLDWKSFSIKDQLLMKNRVLNTAMTIPNNPGKLYSLMFNYYLNVQSSILTAWTFVSFSNYDTFAAGPVNITDQTMTFGQCNDDWNNTNQALSQRTDDTNFRNPLNLNNEHPPVPGNCVTGGRTGYSVKLISPNLIRDGNSIENPIDDSFFNF
jgi:hypothetical protein